VERGGVGDGGGDVRDDEELLGAMFDARLRQIEQLKDEVARLREENRQLRQQLEDAERGTGRHIVELREDGFTIMHPLSCRPNLFDCVYNWAAAVLEPEEHELGRFYCALLTPGRLTIQEPV
jgi:hypothetical protein